MFIWYCVFHLHVVIYVEFFSSALLMKMISLLSQRVRSAPYRQKEMNFSVARICFNVFQEFSNNLIRQTGGYSPVTNNKFFIYIVQRGRQNRAISMQAFDICSKCRFICTSNCFSCELDVHASGFHEDDKFFVKQPEACRNLSPLWTCVFYDEASIRYYFRILNSQRELYPTKQFKFFVSDVFFFA